MPSVQMAREDWYRRQTWSEDDQRNFFDRLKRSRGDYNKAQYLRIQALYLLESGLYREAVRLLTMLREQYPHEDSQETSAFLQKAECLWAIGDRPGSFEAYGKALTAQRRHPNSRSFVALSFAEHFHDYDGGAYRRLLLKEVGEEIRSLTSLEVDLRKRYAAVMASLLIGLGENEEAQKWKRASEDPQR